MVHYCCSRKYQEKLKSLQLQIIKAKQTWSTIAAEEKIKEYIIEKISKKNYIKYEEEKNN